MSDEDNAPEPQAPPAQKFSGAKGRFEFTGPAEAIEELAKKMQGGGQQAPPVDMDDDEGDPEGFDQWWEHLSKTDPKAKILIERVEPKEVDGVKVRTGRMGDYKISGMTFSELEEKIAKNWGGGEYGLDLRDGKGIIRGRRPVEIDGDPHPGQFLGAPPELSPEPDPRVDRLTEIVEHLAERQGGDQTGMMMTLLMKHFEAQQLQAQQQNEAMRMAHERAIEQMKADREASERRAKDDAEWRAKEQERQVNFMMQVQEKLSRKSDDDPLDKMLKYSQFYETLKANASGDGEGEGKGIMGYVGDAVKLLAAAQAQAQGAAVPDEVDAPDAPPALPAPRRVQQQRRRGNRPNPALPSPVAPVLPGPQTEVDVNKQAKAIAAQTLNRILDGLLIEAQTKPRVSEVFDAILDRSPQEFLEEISKLESIEGLGTVADKWGISKMKLLALKGLADENPKTKVWIAEFWEDLIAELNAPEEEESDEGDDEPVDDEPTEDEGEATDDRGDGEGSGDTAGEGS